MKWFGLALLLCVAASEPACNNPATASPRLVFVTVTQGDMSAEGDPRAGNQLFRIQMVATANYYPVAERKDVTHDAIWKMSTPDAGTISADGVLTVPEANHPVPLVVTATYQNVVGTYNELLFPVNCGEQPDYPGC